MTITQIFNVAINGTDVTDKIDTCSLSIQGGRVFDVFSVKAAHEPGKGQTVSATIGDTAFSGFVHSVEKISKLMYEIVCRSNGAKLLEPYSESTVKLEDANTSSELFALYSAETGVTITDTTAEIDFLGSFERNGDHATAIEAVANVTGAELYADGGTVRIAPNKPITETGIVIEDNEIFDFAETMDTNDGGGIGYVEINNGGDAGSTGIAKNTINTEMDKDTGELMIYLSPNGDIDDYNGMIPPNSVLKKRIDSTNVKDAAGIELAGAISSISSVTLNGAKITNYEYKDGLNVLSFTQNVTGRVEVTYTAYAKRTFVTTNTTPDGLFYDYEIVYRDQVNYGYGVLHTSETSQVQVGESTVTSLDGLAVSGGENVFYSDNQNLKTRVYINGVIADATVEKEASNDTFVETITYVDTEEHENVFFPRLPYSEVLGVDGNDSVYNEVAIDGKQAIVFDRAVQGAKISYAIDATKYTVNRYPKDGDSVSIVVSYGEYEEEFSYVYSEPPIFVCAFPMSITVDVANELEVSVSKVSGIAIPTTDDQGNSYGTKYTDHFGKITMIVNTDGRYKLDTGSIINGSYIVVVVDTGGALW